MKNSMVGANKVHKPQQKEEFIRTILAEEPKGFTLLELAVVLAGIALMATVAIPYYIRQAEIAAANKTTREVSSIQEASKWYYLNNKVWPASVGTLQGAGFLNPSWFPANAWGNSYSVSSTAMSFTVTTSIPASVAGVLTRALPGVSVLGGTVSSVIPVPGQEASLTSVTNLANTAQSTANSAQSAANSAQSTANSALSTAQSSAVPPYGSIASIGPNTGISLIWDCPDGYVVKGIGSNTNETVRSVRCQRISR